MIKTLFKPHLALWIFTLLIGTALIPKTQCFVFVILATALYISTVYFFSKKLGESELTLSIGILLNILLFIVLFTNFLPNPNSYSSDQRDYNHLAQLLYAHKQYGLDIRETPTPTKLFGITLNKGVLAPTAYRPVGYPFFVALIYFLTKPGVYHYVIGTQYILHLLSLFLFWKISKRVLGDKPSSISLVLYSMNIPLLFLSNTFLTENLSQFLLLLLIHCYLLFFNKRGGWLEVLLGGIGGGWLILSRPIFISYLPILLALPVYQRIRTKKINMKTVTTVLITLLICFLWSLRNSLAAGRFVNVATNGGINMFLGNNFYIVNGRAVAWPGERVSEILEDTDKSVTGRMEYEAINDNKFRKAAIEWIIDKPVLATRLGISKMEQLFLPVEGLFDNLLHFNVPRLDKYYLVTLYQSIYFWVFLSLTAVGISHKKSFPLLLSTTPYIGIIILSFAITRYQVPIYIPMALIGSLAVDVFKDKKSFYKALLVVTLIIFSKHILSWRETLIQPLRNYIYATQRTRTLYRNFDGDTLFLVETNHEGRVDNFIFKNYNVGTHLETSLIHQNKILNVEEFELLTTTHKILTPYIDILDNLAEEYVENFSLIYERTYTGTPIFRIAPNNIVAVKNTKVISEGLVSDLRNEEKLVINLTPDLQSRYTEFWIFLTKEGYVKILGEDEIVLRVRPRELNGTKVKVLIPNEYLKNKTKVYIMNKPVPYHPHHVSIFKKDNRYTWGENDMGIRRILAIY